MCEFREEGREFLGWKQRIGEVWLARDGEIKDHDVEETRVWINEWLSGSDAVG